MKKLSLLFILFALCFTARAQLVTGTLVITNAPVNTSTLTVNGTVFNWTNGTPIGNKAILITNTLPGDATNLVTVVGVLLPSQGVFTLQSTNATNITFTGFGLAASITTNWASLTFTTNAQVTATNVTVPMSTLDASARTNISSQLIADLNLNSTNAISQTAIIAVQLVGISNSQTIVGVKLLTNLNNLFVGTVSNSYLTNIQRFSGVIGSVSGGVFNGDPTFYDGSAGAVVFSNGSGDSFNIDIPTGNELDFVSANPNPVYTFDGNLFAPTFTGHIDPQYFIAGTATAAITFSNVNNGFLGNISNSILLGTNTFNGKILIPAYANSSLVNSNNADIQIGTNSYVQLSGPSAAFYVAGIAGGADGRILTLENTTAQVMVVGNQSGVESTAANRILTGYNADRQFTNSPGCVMLRYDGGVSRWKVLNP